MCPILMVFTKITWDKMADSYETLCDSYINQSADVKLLHKEWVLLCITNLLYQKKAYSMSFRFMYKKANILWYAIIPKSVICAQHTQFTFKIDVFVYLHAFQYYKV